MYRVATRRMGCITFPKTAYDELYGSRAGGKDWYRHQTIGTFNTLLASNTTLLGPTSSISFSKSSHILSNIR